MNNDFLGHSWWDLPMIFTRDFVTRENYWQIASLVTQKSLFTVTHALLLISCMIDRGSTLRVIHRYTYFFMSSHKYITIPIYISIAPTCTYTKRIYHVQTYTFMWCRDMFQTNKNIPFHLWYINLRTLWYYTIYIREVFSFGFLLLCNIRPGILAVCHQLD